MHVKVFDSYLALSEFLAIKVLSIVKNNPAAVLCLAAGDTPRLAYQLIGEKAKSENINFSSCIFIGLDEWVGIPPENEGSCHYFLKKYLFDPLNISPANTHLFNALSDNLHHECTQMDAIISKVGGIDCMVVGIGMNGHIGFNEPGVSFDQTVHVIELDESTRLVGQKYFKQPVDLQKGITLGLQQLLSAKEAILMANGRKKAEIIKKAIEETIDPLVPASIMQLHHNGSVLLDKEAASLLSDISETNRTNGHSLKR
jgi:glucosamine-6-phosphate isomerase